MDANAPVDTLTTTGLRKLQRDHDGDGRGDVCDFCPHLASAQQDADADGDKIGAPCDPSESVKNQAAEFNGFYDAPVLSALGRGGAGLRVRGAGRVLLRLRRAP